jgi:hypothetical protein
MENGKSITVTVCMELAQGLTGAVGTEQEESFMEFVLNWMSLPYDHSMENIKSITVTVCTELAQRLTRAVGMERQESFMEFVLNWMLSLYDDTMENGESITVTIYKELAEGGISPGPTWLGPPPTPPVQLSPHFNDGSSGEDNAAPFLEKISPFPVQNGETLLN